MKTTVTAIVATLALLAGQQTGLAEQPSQELVGGYFNSADPGSLLVRGQQEDSLFPPGVGANFCTDCCPYCWQGYGEFLYLRAGNAEITYGVPTTGSLVGVTNPLALGRSGVVDADYQPAFRAGVARRLDECSTIGLSYTQFESDTIDELHVFDPQVLYPLVLSPAVLATDPVWRDAYARHDIDFRLIDADYRYTFASDSRYDAAVLIGARYLNLEQAASIAFYAPALDTIGDEYLFTDVDFDGGGIRLGLEGERRAANCGLLVYGKTAASFVAGEFRADLLQARGTGNGAIPIVDTSWQATRLVTMLDLEVGVGWTALDGRLRLSGGYMISGWFNTVRTSDWIRAVQTSDFASLSAASDKVMTFDGIVGRAELRF
jgi:Legionella pneumophila major outer membrane protein precursor